jgi:hypothetical protein
MGQRLQLIGCALGNQGVPGIWLEVRGRRSEVGDQSEGREREGEGET